MIENLALPVPEKLVQDECGIVAFYNPIPQVNLDVCLWAGRGVQHRGQQGAGVCLKTEEEIIRYTGSGLLREVFTPEVIDDYNKPAQWILLHCRYGTAGGYGDLNYQPVLGIAASEEKVSVIHNGQFVGLETLMNEIGLTDLPEGASDTYIFTQLLAQMPGDTWEAKILNLLDKVKGAYSLAIGVGNKLFLARDQLGIRPFVIGKRGETWIAASETHALARVGIDSLREIKRGEIIVIDKEGFRVLRQGLDGPGHFCDLEMAYFSRPDSLWPADSKSDSIYPRGWQSFADFRYKCGRILARKHPIPNASIVVGVPDSGIYVGQGYADQLGIKVPQMIVRDHFDQNGDRRLFMADDDMVGIKSRVLAKLSLIYSKIWEDAVVVVGDDSIIRGNVSSELTRAIFALGAREVHWVSGFAQVSDTCHLGVSMRTKEELIASCCGADPRRIAQEIGATSVYYIEPKDFLAARLNTTVKTPKDPLEIFLENNSCGGCLTGHYPISKEGIVYRRDS